MDMTDESWHLVKNTPKVTGFLGTGNRPSPISAKEAERILYQVKEGVERPRPSIIFEVGEQVRVCDGPFTSFNGLVEEVDEEKARSEGDGVDFRPRDTGRAGIQPGREGLDRDAFCGRPSPEDHWGAGPQHPGAAAGAAGLGREV